MVFNKAISNTCMHVIFRVTLSDSGAYCTWRSDHCSRMCCRNWEICIIRFFVRFGWNFGNPIEVYGMFGSFISEFEIYHT